MEPLAFEGWYRSEHPKLLRALVVISGSQDEAAEVVDEAFARAYERWNRVARMDSPAGWTYRTALNLVRRRGRRSSMEQVLHRRSAAGAPRQAAPADWSPEVWDAVRALSLRERTAVALRYVADLSLTDIATSMDIAPGTVGSTLHGARRHLAELLGDDEPDDTDPPDVADVSESHLEVRDA
jgi:RNA polymerase sigma-70 factor (ECF subfamily)